MVNNKCIKCGAEIPVDTHLRCLLRWLLYTVKLKISL